MSSNADAELSHRLIEADNEWWDRDPAEVNGDIARWLEELRGPDRAQIIEQNSPVIVEDAQGRVDIAPNPQFDRITNRIALRQALIELRPIADTLNGCLDGNRIMPSLNLTLVDYRARISGDVDAILWGLVDRYAQAIKAGFKELDRAELDEPTWVHVDHFIELHDACIACSARVAADPVPELDEARLTPQALRNPFTVLQDAKERLLEGDHSTPAFDNYVAEAIELGRTLELPRPDASPEARKSRLASLGATLASTGAVFENLDKIISAGARFVDWAAKPEVLRSIKKAAEALWALFSWK